jgi:hypothetical protein
MVWSFPYTLGVESLAKQEKVSMTSKMILALVCFFTSPAITQESPKHQKEAQCKFSDGKTITIMYSSERVPTATLATNEELVTVKGTKIPAGDYSIGPEKDSHNIWLLNVRKRIGKSESLDFVSLPLLVKQPTFPIGTFNISFDHTGGSCMMHWDSEISNVRLSLEFTEMNTDVPLIPESSWR